MKVIVIRGNLKKALDSVVRVTGENSNLPILKNILIKTSGSGMIFSSTNLEIALSYKLSGKIIENGEITVPAAIFYSIINNLSNEVINLDIIEKNNLRIKTDNYEATVNTLPTEDFPIIPNISKENSSFKIDVEKIKRFLEQVLSSTQFSDLRPEINGILFNFDGNILKLAGTDSFRLSEKTVTSSDFNSNIKEGFKTIIPLKAINEFLKVFQEGIVEFYFDNNQVLFKNDEIEMVSRLIDGDFPDYEQILPKSAEIEVIVDKEEMINALKVTGVLSGKVHDVLIKIKKDNKYIEIFSLNQGIGENKYIIPAKIKGEDLEINFNWQYLLSGIKSFKGEKIILGFNGSDRPTIIKSIEDEMYFYILMPVKN
ncbi:MAG: DNA polymerase III subunit beta [Candidatus Pacebacteria bacterium]|nr:DNA polymerase III subunit beta [Candidatus Paceibacterota bacterium]